MSLSELFTKQVRAGPGRHCSKGQSSESAIAIRPGWPAPTPSQWRRHRLFALALPIVLALANQFFGCRREGSQNDVKWKGQDSAFEKNAAESTHQD
jgi:hypothetical protein